MTYIRHFVQAKGNIPGLVYKLTQSAKAKRKLGLQTLGAIEEALVDSLVKMIPDFEEDPLTVLLGHQYTPANFSLSQLKGHDRARAKALLAAAEQAGYYAKAGLLLVSLWRYFLVA